jgi:hypothetical protein
MAETLEDRIARQYDESSAIRPEELQQLLEASKAKTVGGNRALFNGLGFGWGAEAESVARAAPELFIHGADAYANAARNAHEKITKEQKEYQENYPGTNAVQQFVGGVLPAVASPATAAVKLAPKATGALSRAWELAAPYVSRVPQGITQGAIQGAGDRPDDRVGGALEGAGIGTGIALAVPPLQRGASSALNFLKSKLAPDSEKEAAALLGKAADKAGMSYDHGKLSADLQARLIEERMAGIDNSSLMNLDPHLAALARKVAGESKFGSKVLGEKALRDIEESPNKAYLRLKETLGAGDYQKDLDALIEQRRNVAPDIYDKVQQLGDINDPKITYQLDNSPVLKSLFNEINSVNKERATTAIANGEDPSRFLMKEIYEHTRDHLGNIIDSKLVTMPDFRTLDLMKRGLDARIRAGFANREGLNPEKAAMFRDQRDLIVKRMDDIAPEYKDFRTQYGDMKEIEEAGEIFTKDFSKMRPEHIAALYSDLSDPAKELARTATARHFYDLISDAAESESGVAKILTSKTNREKLMQMFDGSEAKYDLFQAAMRREGDLHLEARKLLKASGRDFDEEVKDGSAFRDAAVQLMKSPKGAASALTVDAMKAATDPTMTDEVAQALTKNLLASNPKQVAAAVKVIEGYRLGEAERMVARTQKDKALVSGLIASRSSEYAEPDKSADQILNETRGSTDLSPDLEKFLQDMKRERAGEK